MAKTESELMAKYEGMTDKENDDQGIALGAEREKQAINLAQRVFEAARALCDNGRLRATGYRVLVINIESKLGLEEAEAEIAPTLLDRGFQVKTEAQKAREQRGEDHAVVLDIGPIAFERLGGKAAWCDVGDVVVYTRYAGIRVEHPRGSGVFYQLINDEDIGGRMV